MQTLAVEVDDMREYAKISPKFWIGETGKRLRSAGMEAQIVALYLLSNPHANMIGLYYLPKTFIAHETGLGIEGASKGLRGAIEAGFCMYDEASEVVYVCAMARFQVAESLKPADKRVTNILKVLMDVPKNPYFERFMSDYGDRFCLYAAPDGGCPTEGASKGLRSQEQEQEQEQEKEIEENAPGGAPSPADVKGAGKRGRRKRDTGVTFEQYRAALTERGEKLISADDPIILYAEGAGIGRDFLAVHWHWFIRIYSIGGERAAKTYEDWRAVFRNSVRGNWGKLWAFNRSGDCYLTTEGQQLQNAAAAGVLT